MGFEQQLRRQLEVNGEPLEKLLSEVLTLASNAQAAAPALEPKESPRRVAMLKQQLAVPSATVLAPYATSVAIQPALRYTASRSGDSSPARGVSLATFRSPALA